MKEFVEKLNEKLYENVKSNSCPSYSCWEHSNKNCDKCNLKKIMISDVIEIVNQLAEEYDGEELRNSQEIYNFIEREINPYGKPFEGTVYEFGLKVMKYIRNLSTEEYNNGWIAFTQREMTEEEKEVYGEDLEYILDCKLPDDGEEIIVCYKNGYVDTDTFIRDTDGCYLDSGNDFIDDVIAWMPLPAPYRKGE